jgi:hypothetical protein
LLSGGVRAIIRVRSAEREGGDDRVAEGRVIEIEMPGDLGEFKLPAGVHERLHELLDRQDRGETLTAAERREAEGLVELAEFLSLLRLRAKRIARAAAP